MTDEFEEKEHVYVPVSIAKKLKDADNIEAQIKIVDDVVKRKQLNMTNENEQLEDDLCPVVLRLPLLQYSFQETLSANPNLT